MKGAFNQYLLEMSAIGVGALLYFFATPDQSSRGAAIIFVIITTGLVFSTVVLLVRLRQEKLAKAKGIAPSDTPPTP